MTDFSRRNFLTGTTAFGLLSTALGAAEVSEVLAQPTTPPSETTLGQKYFDHLYSSDNQRSRSSTDAAPPSDRMARILHFSDSKGLRWAEDVKEEELPSFEDDAVLSMEITGFRPGEGDKSHLAKVRFSQLHLSCQRIVGSQFLGPIAWAALATVFMDKASKISEQSLEWQNFGWGEQPAGTNNKGSKLNYTLLNHGAGHMSLDLISTPRQSVLDKILSITIKGAEIVSPLMSFPGICVPALKAFYATFSAWEQARAENFLLATGRTDIAVTKQGAESGLISRNALPLLTGDYILFPEAYKADMDSGMSKLTVQKGFLVEKDAGGDPEDRKKNAIPSVSYISLSVKVQSASDFPAMSTVTDPLLDKEPAGATAGSEKKPKKP